MRRTFAAALIASSSLLLCGPSANAQCTSLVSENYAGALGGIAYCSATFDDGSGPHLFAGGALTLDGVACALVELVDGKWVRVPGVTGTVRTLEVMDDSSGPALYMGGRFTLPSSPSQTISVAKWSGSAWTPIRSTSGPSDVVALARYPAVPTGVLYAAQANSSGLYRWNGTAWEPMQILLSGWLGIRALKVLNDGSDDKLYIAGSISAVGGQPANGVVTWDGSTFAPIGTGFIIPYPAPDVRSVILHDDGSGPKVHIAGVIDLTSRNVGNTQVAALIGNVWTSVLTVTSQRGSSVLASIPDEQGPALYVATGVMVESTNQVRVLRNGAWSNVGPAFQGGTPGSLTTIHAFGVHPTPTGPKILALGNFATNESPSAQAVAELRDNLWQSPASKTQGLVSVTARPFADPQAATGELYLRSMVHTQNAWSTSSIPFEASGGHRVMIAGQSRFVVWGTGRISMQSASGGWTILPLPSGFSSGPVFAVDSGSGPELYAFHSNNGFRLSKFVNYAWQPVGPPLPASFSPTSLASLDTGNGPRLFVSSRADTQPSNLLEFDGTQWSPIKPVEGPIFDLRAFDFGEGPELVIAGTLAPIGPVNFGGLARWNGARVAPIGNGLNLEGKGRTLAVIDSFSGPQLWAGGADGLAYAYWNGSAWICPHHLSSPATVSYITPVNNPNGSRSIFLAGSFTHIAEVSSRNIAEIITCPPSCTADFDQDGNPATDADIQAFFACLAGNCCPTCAPADFNNDGDTATDADIESFFRVLAGGPC